MNYEEIKLMVGRNLRNARMAKGMTQDELAEKVAVKLGTEIVGKTISKYEREGVERLSVILALSDILGQDLQVNPSDLEGRIGEVGKEILFTLIKNGGYLHSKELFDILFGLPQDEINREISKLVAAWLVVRERYNDWTDETVDIVFITAKGLITFKNLQLNDKQRELVEEKIDSVVSYEQAIGNYDSYGDRVNRCTVERLIRNIQFEWNDGVGQLKTKGGKKDYPLIINTDYRINYINWLKQHFESSVYPDQDFGKDVPGVGIYHDILYRMAMNITRDNSMSAVCLRADITAKITELSEKLGYQADMLDNQVVDGFVKEGLYHDEENGLLRKMNLLRPELEKVNYELNWHWEHYGEGVELSEEKKKNYDELCYISNLAEKIDELISILQRSDGEFVAMRTELDVMEYRRPEGGLQLPLNWYSDTEIGEFIKVNMGPAETAEEKAIDEYLKKINALDPSTLDYYTLPQKWEENGLADLVRKSIGLENP